LSTASFAPCPHCHAALSYLEGVTASTRTPRCPRCRTVVAVDRPTFLMLDTSRRAIPAKPAAKT
jgi:hypothetical protein